MSDTPDDCGPGTRLVSAGRRPEWTGPVVNVPVWRASTHLYADSADLAAGRPNADGHFYYGRRGTPTQWALCDALTGLEPGATGTLLYPSGLAAISGALLGLLDAGDVLLMSDNAYEPSRALAEKLLAPLGIETRWFDPLDLEAYRAAFCPRTRVVLLESPGSLTMEVCDVPALAAIALQHGAISVLDNTWAGPTGFAALAHGVDVSVLALTKHVGGHSDLMLGAVTASGEVHGRLRERAQLLGQVVSPDDAALALRGLRTLGLRLERQTASALAVAQWLQGQAQVAHVLCPMLPGAPGHELWLRDFTGGCGLFSFVLRGRSVGDRARLIDALRLFGIGFSWGGFESLAIPVDPQRIRTSSIWPKAGWAAEDRLGVRLAIGLEDPADLIADLQQALDAMDRA
ncbi:cystathionine beta-lyase [Croceibacterium mercuriale]|uniref:Cystathionine beta-lyase n=1 Tax=Croceibacterium mercuriale TaxID=1572751 RepID=A0A0B2BXW0_9SPHN|nr:cystathionine beta-lyase [Croceibacterium mercuriale]KHL26448.1 cystathionine beta-lyase [Croceibacterium mercuriale]